VRKVSIRTLDEFLRNTKQEPKTIETTKATLSSLTVKITGFYKETDFKQTPIGKIPKQWDITKLQKVSLKIKAGGTPKVSIKEYWNGGIPFVKIEDITSASKYLNCTKTTISKLGLKNSSAWIIPKNSLLLAMYGSMGEVAINKIEVATNQAILGIIPSEKTYVEYLYYWFQYFKPQWQKYAKLTTQPNLTAQIVRNAHIPLPSLAEQWGVAEVLSSVDRAIEKTEELIGRLERLRKALMQELLTKGIGHKEYKQTPIGKIPIEWNIVKLGSIFIFKNGKRPEIVKEKGVVPIYGAGFLQGYTNKPMINLENVIIIARVGKGSAGKVYLASGKMWISDNAIYAVPNNNRKVYSPFYYYYLQYLRLDKIAVRSAAGGYSLITQSSLSNLYVPLPPINEQQIIYNILNSIDNWITLEFKRKEKLEKLKRGLMNLLLTGRVRVKVEVVNASNTRSLVKDTR